MSRRSSDPRSRAERFLRWYPAEWRSRYGNEFEELLVSDISERPRCPRRTFDVAVGGLMARGAEAGLVGPGARSSRQAQRSLVTSGCAIAVFMVVAISMWSQLNVARSWSAPATSDTRTALLIMTVALFSCLGITLVGAVPVAWELAGAICQPRGREIRRPALLFCAGIALLVAGGLYFRHGWVRSGLQSWGHHVVGHDVAVSFLWASTVTVSSYWAHPTILLSFPLAEIGWMAVSPLAIIASLVGAAGTMRRLDLSPRTLKFATYTVRAASVGLALFLFATLLWLIDGGPGPNDLFQAGTVDLIGVGAMVITLGITARSVRGITPTSCSPAGRAEI